MPYCAVKSCRNSSGLKNLSRGGISYHRFPKDAIIKNKWINAPGQENWFPPKYSTICSEHFLENDFWVSPKGNRYILDTAVPTQKIVCNVKPSSSGCVEVELVPIKQEQSVEGEMPPQSSNYGVHDCTTLGQPVAGRQEQDDGGCDYSFRDLIKIKLSEAADLALVKQEHQTPEDAFCSRAGNETVQDNIADVHPVSGKRRRCDSDSGDSYTVTIENAENPHSRKKSVVDSFESNDQVFPQVRRLKLELKRAHETIRMKTLEVKRFREKNRRLTKKVTKMADIIQSLRKQLLNKAPIGSEDVQSESLNSDDSVITDPMEDADAIADPLL